MANTHSTDLEASSSQYFSITNASQTGLKPDDGTVEAWIKLESLPSGSNMVIAGAGNMGGAWDMWVSTSNKLTGRVRFSSDTTATGSTSLVAGVWYHVAMTWNNSTKVVKVYLNGVEDGSATGSGAIQKLSFDVTVGAKSSGTTLYFDGLIDNVMVWSETRSASQIQDDLGTILTGTETNLEGYWKFDNDATDETANSNDLTANNTPTYTTDVPFSGELVDVSTDSTLATNLVSYWELEEASGTRVDSHGSNDLTDNNTVGQGTGIQGNGADFEKANSEYLNIADNASLSITGDMTITGWINPESSTGNDCVVSKWNTTGNQRSFAFYYTSGNTMRAFISSDGTNANTSKLDISTAGAITDLTLQQFAIVYDASAGTIYFYLDGVLNNVSTGHKTSIFDSTADFYLGYFSQDFAYFDGIQDEMAIYNRMLTAGEVHNLYNGGSGLPYQAAVAATFTPKVMWL